jgi:hypothetical protein
MKLKIRRRNNIKPKRIQGREPLAAGRGKI